MAVRREIVQKLSATAAAAIVACWSVPGSSQTDSAPQCSPFTVETRVEVIRFVDLDPVGKGLGDFRIGASGLFDEDGTRIGSTYFRSTIIPSPETGADMVLATLVHAFSNGTISATVLAHLADARDEDLSTTETTHQAITGGTEAFSSAHGSATISTGNDGARLIAFDISCD